VDPREHVTTRQPPVPEGEERRILQTAVIFEVFKFSDLKNKESNPDGIFNQYVAIKFETADIKIMRTACLKMQEVPLTAMSDICYHLLLSHVSNGM
jgi:hypothetical protein